LWLHSLKVAQLLRSAACLHTNQSRSYLNHLVCHETEINPVRRRLFYTNNSQEEDEMRELKVFVHSRCEGDREEVRELCHYGRDLIVVEREMSCTACSLGQWTV